jgi:lysine 2,3-aminomutase
MIRQGLKVITPKESNSMGRKSPITSVGQLSEEGLVESSSLAGLERVAEQFSVRLTGHVADLISANDIETDVIARQFIPSIKEFTHSTLELADPIGDRTGEIVPGLIQKYPDRVLLKIVNVCAVYCRFCFRRESVGKGHGTLTEEELARALGYIASHSKIWEVILSGGDPLLLPSARIGSILDRIAAIGHVKCMRIHTRIPIVDPSRIESDLVQALRRKKPTWVAIHCNHAKELTEEVQHALATLADGGVPLISQTVLLRGVNDDVATLDELFRALVACRVKPYQLHHCDLAEGTRHFRIAIKDGQKIMRGLTGRMSGMCHPSYMLDIPGGYGKIPIGPNWATEDESGAWRMTDFKGDEHGYIDDVEEE